MICWSEVQFLVGEINIFCYFVSYTTYFQSSIACTGKRH
jgi:hypothetical protein